MKAPSPSGEGAFCLGKLGTFVRKQAEAKKIRLPTGLQQRCFVPVPEENPLVMRTCAAHTSITAGPLNDVVDSFDGMIARFDLRDLSIGVQESNSPTDLIIVAYPSPATDQLIVRAPSWAIQSCELLIIDATGRVVLRNPYQQGTPIPVDRLASGAYSLTLRQLHTGVLASGRFIRL